MLAVRLPKEIEDRLDVLAKSTGRTKSFYARKAILSFMEDMEDIAIAEERLRDMGETMTWEEVKAHLFDNEMPADAA
jgi:RHH-type transcriptional regulator, rel operon repressor / antitoxin RelB